MVISVVVTAAVVGGAAIYFVMNLQSKNNDLKKQITGLEQTITVKQTVTATQTTNQTTSATTAIESQTPAPTSSTLQPLSLNDLKNGSYSLPDTSPELTGTFQLTDGIYKKDNVTVNFVDDFNAVSPDNSTNAVILNYNDGGSGTFYYLAIYQHTRLSLNGQIAITALGDRVQVKSLYFKNSNDVININMLTHGPSDPSCCPTQDTTKSFFIGSNSLIEVK